MVAVWMSVCQHAWIYYMMASNGTNRSGKGSSNDCLRPCVLTRTVTMMMSSGERGLFEFHSNVTPEPNGTDLVESCDALLLNSSEAYGGGDF